MNLRLNMDKKLQKKKVNILHATSKKVTKEVVIGKDIDENGEEYEMFLQVKGLSTNDIAFLYTQSPELLSYLLEDIDFENYSSEKIVTIVMNKMPGLAYLVVGLALDEVEDSGLVGDLNITVVGDLLRAVLDLTIPSDLNELKKLLAMMNSTFLKPKNP